MSLVHRVDQIGPDVVALGCHQCRARFSVGDIAVFGDPLRCIDCGAGGMIPYAASKLGERFPASLASRFTPLPEALMDHAGALGLGANELVVIWALERHRRLMGDQVYPGRAVLAKHSGLSEHQVKRATSKLVAKRLIDRWQPGKKQAIGRGSNRYCLDPLWRRIEQLESLPSGSAPLTDLGEHTRPQTDTDEGLRAEPNPFAGADDEVCSAPVRHEVDVVEVDAVQGDLASARTAPRPLAAEPAETPDQDEIPDDGELERMATFEHWRAEHPDISILVAWEQFNDEQREQAAA